MRSCGCDVTTGQDEALLPGVGVGAGELMWSYGVMRTPLAACAVQAGMAKTTTRSKIGTGRHTEI
jgi:hypothetical protein